MTSSYQRKPRFVKRHLTPEARNEACLKLTYVDGALTECGAPTTKGRNYCDQCASHLITLFDRPAQQVVKVQKHRWRETMFRGKAA